jgi:hypothetical protein
MHTKVPAKARPNKALLKKQKRVLLDRRGEATTKRRRKTSAPSDLYVTFLLFHAKVYLLYKLSNLLPSTPNKKDLLLCQRLHPNPEVSTPGASVTADFGPPELGPKAELYYLS